MLEVVSNIIQIAVLVVCIAAAVYNTDTLKSRSWVLFGLFAVSFLLGDIWWLLDLLFYRDRTLYSLIPYINWKASALFLILLIRNRQQAPLFKRPVRSILWVIPVFCAGMCAYYMQFGAYVDNVITALFMAVLIWITIQRFLEIRGSEDDAAGDKSLCLVVLLFCVSEYAMWTASCLDYDHPLRILYDVFSFVLTLSIALMIPALRKAVSR